MGISNSAVVLRHLDSIVSPFGLSRASVGERLSLHVQQLSKSWDDIHIVLFHLIKNIVGRLGVALYAFFERLVNG